MGAINSSWTLHRTELLQLQAEEVIEEAKTVYTDEVKREHFLSSIWANVTRMQDVTSTVTQLYHIMDKSTHIEILGMECTVATYHPGLQPRILYFLLFPLDFKTTLFKYFNDSKGAPCSSHQLTVVTPESYGLKVYLKSEIESANGLKQERQSS